mgnify:CR=1 FL=1|jgi:glucosamine-6-phosphate deaminase
MKIIVVKDYQAMSDLGAEIIANTIKTNPSCTLGLATGSSPIGTYQNLVKAFQNKEISFKDVKTYNLDEYCGISRNHPQSYYYFMHDNLFNHVDIQEENVHIPMISNASLEEDCKSYNDMLNNTTIDLQLLGIGGNGHIGFNEPGTPFNQETFIVKLTDKTRKDNQRFFNSLDEVPTHAITMGISNIMKAKKILMLISGANKADTVVKLLSGEVTTDFPASILNEHPDVTVIIDQDAYSKVK